MSQCIETISALNPQGLQKTKRLFWDSTSLTNAFESWFKKVSPSFLRHREQIRVLSVFSTSPDVDLYVIRTIQKLMTRFRYVIVEPNESKYYEKVLSSAKTSSLQCVEISPYPHFLTYETMENFDLIFVFGLPLNRNATEIVLRKSKLLLRHSGQVILLNNADNDLGELIRLLHSNSDDSNKTTQSPTVHIEHSSSRTKHPNSPTMECEESMQTIADSHRGKDDIEEEDPSPKISDSQRPLDISESYPCDDQFVRSVLDYLGIVYTMKPLIVRMDIGECIRKSQDGIHILSGLLKIDLSRAMEPLINEILGFLLVKLSPNTSYLPYNFTIYTILSDVLSDIVHKQPNQQPTQWFPEGERGGFVNAGLNRWTKSVIEWRAEETDEPYIIKKVRIESIDPLVDIISNTTISSCHLPEPINLDELMPLCSEVWKMSYNE